MYILNSIEKCTSRKSGKTFYKLYCADTYDHGRWECGSPMKVIDVSEKVLDKALEGNISVNAPFVVGKVVYTMYNEYGYCSFIRFYDQDDKKQTASAPTAASMYSEPAATETDGEYPFET